MARGILVTVTVLLAASGAVVGGLLALRQLDERVPGVSVGTFDPADPQLGRRSYVFCQGCHGLDGKGVARYAPALAASRWLTGDPQAAILIILQGFDTTAEPGAAYVSTRMLGHAAQMSDPEIAAVLTWTRSQWGNAAAAIPPQTVAALRQRHGGRSAPWSPAELRALAP